MAKRYVADVFETTGGKNLDTDKQDNLTEVNFGTFINGVTTKTTPVDADQFGYMDSEDGNKFKKFSWTNLKAALLAYFDGIYSKKYGTRTVLSGTAIDWSADTDVYTKTLTTNTTLTDINLPSGTNTRTITLSIDGAYTLTVPAYWKWKGGTYDTTKTNQIVLQCVNGNSGSERVNYIINPDL